MSTYCRLVCNECGGAAEQWKSGEGLRCASHASDPLPDPKTMLARMANAKTAREYVGRLRDGSAADEMVRRALGEFVARWLPPEEQ